MNAPRLRVVALLLLAGAPAYAQTSAGQPADGHTFTPPVLEGRVPAVYPKAAADLGLSATVVLEFDVDESGEVLNVVVKTPVGHGFDEAAVEAVKRWRFKPGLGDGHPVSSHVTYAYKFVLKVVTPPPAVVKKKADETVRWKGGVFLRGTRAPVSGGKVIVLPTPAIPDSPASYESVLDDQGHFELKGLPSGRYHVIINGPKAKRFETDETLADREVLTVNYYLEPSQYTRYESTVRADLNREEISRQVLTTEELVKMPGTMGDALRAIENLPGVARSPFNTGLIIVRGGKPTDSKVFIAGSEVPQLYHFGGLTSIIPTQVIDQIDYFAGNFGVRYGRGIAGAIDVDLREGKRDRWHGAIEANVFDAGALAEGPVGKGSLILAARRSYVDALIGLLPIPGLKFTEAPVYYDYQAALDYPLAGGKLRVMILGSDDQLKLVFNQPADADAALSSFGTHIYFHKAQLRYTKTYGKWQLLAQLAGGYQGQAGALGRDLRFDIGVGSVDARVEGRYQRSKQLRLLFGTDLVYANVSLNADVPNPTREGQVPSPISAGQKFHAHETLNIGNIGLYAEASWKPTDRVSITPGLRFDYYSALQHQSFDPRLTGRFQLGKYTWLKAGVGLFSQSPQASDYDAVFGNPHVRPEKALHTALTVEQGLLPGLLVEVTGFYKHLWDLSTVTGNYVLDGDKIHPERVASQGTGRVYGLELLARQAVSKYFFGIVSYTLMRSERKDCETCGWRLFDFDQTHVLVVALHAYLPRGFEVGARFRYISGLPYTLAKGGYYDADSDIYAPARSPVNNARLEDFHSLDVRIDKTFLFQKWVLKLYLDVTNVYNHASAEVSQPSFDFTRNATITGLPIVPSFGIRGEF